MIEKFKQYKDKIQHFAVNFAGVILGCVVSLLSLLCFHITTEPLLCAICIAVSFCIGLSIGKEYGDKRAKGNHWCWWDLLADLLGIIAGVFVFVKLYQLAVMLIALL